MYHDGVHNEFETAYQKGLSRGFDLGWSYKGRFDRTLLRDIISSMDATRDRVLIECVEICIHKLKTNDNNREFITNDG